MAMAFLTVWNWHSLYSGGQGLLEGRRLGRYGMHEGTALGAGEYGAVYGRRQLLLTYDQGSPRPAQGLVSGGGHNIRVWNGRWMSPHGAQPRYMSYIGHDLGLHLIGYLPHHLEVYGSGIAGSAHNLSLIHI